MTKETLKLIHRSYQEALERSENILEIVQNLYNILDELEVAEEDSSTFDSFLDGLRGCINSRKKTFEITNMITYVNITFMYIILLNGLIITMESLILTKVSLNKY